MDVAENITYCAIYVPRTLRHLREVKSKLPSIARIHGANVSINNIRFKGDDSTVLAFEIKIGDLSLHGAYYFIGMLLVEGKVSNNHEELNNIANSLYMELATNWNALRKQLVEGTLKFGSCSGTSESKTDILAAKCFLECSTDFVENVAARHRHNYPFETPENPLGNWQDPYIIEIPQLVQRARQAYTCLQFASDMFPQVDKQLLKEVAHQHQFILDYLRLLEGVAIQRHQQRVLQTQTSIDRSIRRLSIAMVILGAVAVLASIIIAVLT